jgi:pimeloyl-ACP methyl ester carboxylesterase
MGLPPTKIVSLPGCNLGVRIDGVGKPLVLLHGMGGGSASWREQFAAWAGELTVAAWDAPGYGASGDGVGVTTSAEGYARLLDSLTETLGFPRFHLLGHSLGALVAAAYAATKPQRLLSLTLSALPRGYGGRPEAVAALHRRVRMLEENGTAAVAAARARHICAPNADPAVVEFIQEVMSGIRPDGYRAAAEVVANADPTRHLAAIGVSTLVLVGECDAVTPPASVAELASLLPHRRLQVIAGAGHATYVERPDAFNAALRDHIAASHDDHD